MMSFNGLPSGGRFRLQGVLRVLALCSLLGAAPAAFAHLNDNFERADGAAIGGGWIEKNPGAFSLSAGRATKLTVGTGYRDNLVYRPAVEDVRDVEAAVELQLSSATPGYPQLAVRVQSATVANADTFDGYLLYAPNSTTELILGRQNGTAFVTALATVALSEPLNTTDRYRLRLAARGTNPVQVDAFMERLDGAIWTTIGQASVTDSAPDRIATAGSVAFGGYVESSYSYDNFVRVDLGALGTANPAPVTAALSPTQANAGESGVTVVVYGAGFTTDSVARWNGASRTTTYVSPSELELQATPADVAAPGTAAVTIANPIPGGGVSNAQTFTIANPGSPPPTIATLTPSSVTAGAAAFTLIVQGTGFNAGSVVRWAGQDRVTTFFSTTEVRASIGAADVADPGNVAVTVTRPSDGTVSAAGSFTVNPAVAGDFVDSFNRADSTTLGNGWIEKNPAAFSILANEVSKPGAGSDYRNNIVYRPASEDLLDAEASVELRPLSTTIGYPQVMVRVQGATVAAADQLDAYLLFMSDSTSQAVLARQRGTEFTTALTSFTVSPALNTTNRYRLRLRATGTDPVQLGGFVELWNGTAWQIIGQAAASDAAANRISTAGAVGFSGYTETNNRYDNFRRTNLGGTPTPNPVPIASSLNPTSAPAGTSAFTLAVSGSNFVAESVVRWNGANRTTTVVSATQLTAAISAADIAAQGSATVTVFNPAPGGGVSGNLTFTITAPPPNNPVPTAGNLSPSQETAGGSAFTLTVNGSNFVNGAAVRWNGSNRTTTFVSSTQLTAAITATDIASQGSATVTVFNPAPGGGTSGNLTFTINAVPNNPVPTAGNLSPSQATAGGAAFTLTVNGANFVNGATVRWNGSDRTTTFVSSTQLTAAIPASDIVSQGTRTVTVFNPTPGGGTSGGLAFTVNPPNNPTPALASITPTSTPAGGPAFTLTLNGSNFVGNSVVRWNGSNRATTFVSATQLTAAISASDIASQGNASVTVFSPTPGGGTSTARTFTISAPSPNNPLPVLTSMSPSTWPTGGGSFTLTVLGSGFNSQSVIQWNGVTRTTTLVSGSELRATMISSDVAASGPISVSVFAPTPGGGRSVPLTFLVQNGSTQYFIDSFNRANNANVGNGWIEKDPNAFALSASEVVSFETVEGFPYNIMYRPVSESWLDVETSVEIRRLPNVPGDLSLANFPQLHARVQTATVATPGSLHSYLFFLWDTSETPQAMFAINTAPQPGVRYECFIRAVPLSESLVTDGRYRLRFRVRGTAPVTLMGSVDRFVNGAWTTIGTGTATHDSSTQLDQSLPCDGSVLPGPITTGGVTGLAKWVNRTDAYDNFYWREALAGESIPAVSSFVPSSVTAGSAGFTLRVLGSGFRPDSVVRWNGVTRPTTFISTGEVRATISAADIALSGRTPVTVSGDMGQLSTEGMFNIAPVSGTVSFDDSFNRANAAAIGNGWIEKTPSSFTIESNVVRKFFGSGDYRDNLAYRPAAEDGLDAEALLEFRLNWTPVGYPQVLARIQQSTAGIADGFDGYLLFMDDSATQAVIARQRIADSFYTPLAGFTLSQALTAGGTYRMRLSTVGTGSVSLQGSIERLSGGVWQVIGQVSVVDSSAQRIATAGAVGFGGHADDSYSYDNFRRVNLGP